MPTGIDDHSASPDGQERPQSAIDMVPVPCALLDAEGRVTAANDAWRDGALDLLVSEGASVLDALGTATPHAERMRGLLDAGSGDLDCVIEAPGPRRLRLLGTPLDPRGAILTVVDVTPFTNGDAANHDTRLVRIIHSAMDAIITVDESHRIVVFNKAAERIFGVSAEEALGSTLTRFIPERFRGAHDDYIDAFGRTGVTMRHMGRLGTLHGVRADGTEFPIEASISQADADGHHFFTVILRDVSERRLLEEQLLHSQKMEGIGRLAGGIAHDFNNLLMAVFNYLTLANHRLEPEHPARAPIGSAREAADRAATLTRQLLAFARKQAVKPRVLQPNEVIRGMEEILRQLVGKRVSLRIDLVPEPWSVVIDASQLEQVVMNLAINARDAMPDGGVLTLTTDNIALGAAEHARVPGAPEGDLVAIVVADTGVGMAPDVLEHIFEPFFTTKPPGEGTGLGLATSHGIVTQAGGRIGVESTPGKGTRIAVYLPRTTSTDTAHDAPDAAPPERGGSETVLLVEESRMVRELIAESLRNAGYTVLGASSGAIAIKTAAAHREPIDLLVIDRVMMDMTGSEVAETIRHARGPVPVIYIAAQDTHSTGDDRVVTLVRPFETDVLLRTIRTVLDERVRT